MLFVTQHDNNKFPTEVTVKKIFIWDIKNSKLQHKCTISYCFQHA